MKKPTIEDLTRIKNELEEMTDYMQENFPVGYASLRSDMVYSCLVDALDGIENCLDRLPDLRDNIITDC